MARRAAAAGQPSQRQLRVGEELRHVVAELLARGHLREPALADARFTVSEVRVSADLRHAVVFVTELVAFFAMEGNSRLADEKKSKKRGDFFAFSRTAFGIVKTRTDGQRLLVYTDSGNVKMKEAYAYSLDDTGVPIPSPVVRA